MTESPLTIASLVDEVLDTAQGYVRGADFSTSLSADMTSSDLSFTVVNSDSMSVGPVEIENELIQVASADVNTGQITVEPWGRGLGGTVAALHLSGARVVVAPLYPRQRVRNAVYGVLREIFPDVFAVASLTQDGSPVRTNYVMPANCWNVLRVETKVNGPSQMWVPVGRWRQNKQVSTVELEILGPVTAGTGTVRIQYMKTPPDVYATGDDLVTLGYDYGVRDLVVLGATARLMAYTETSRVQAQSMESSARAEAVQVGSAASLSRVLDARFRERLESERRQLLFRYPLQPHMTR